MAPRQETDKIPNEQRRKDVKEVDPPQQNYRMEIVWRNVIVLSYVHMAALYGGYIYFTRIKWTTFWWVNFTGILANIGISACSHRYFAHGAFKAKKPLKIFMMILQAMCCQNDIHEWVRDHRLHHQHTDTDADPHNASRGLFFSHCGWLMCRKHPDVKEKGKSVYMGDIEADDVIMFQKKYFVLLTSLFCFLIPSLVPWYFWGETFICSWHTNFVRYCYSLNSTWSVNSFSHHNGVRPFITNTLATDSILVDAITLGDGWHNYHHAFPKDYRYAEYKLLKLNISTLFIDLMAYFGWAYDLHKTPMETVLRRRDKFGDGTQPFSEEVLNGKIVNLF